MTRRNTADKTLSVADIEARQEKEAKMLRYAGGTIVAVLVLAGLMSLALFSILGNPAGVGSSVTTVIEDDAGFGWENASSSPTAGP